MTSIADGSVKIQTTSESNPSPPSWFGEVVLLIGYLRKHGVLSKISEQVRFARRRCGRYEVIDFPAVLFGFAISGERTLEAFYERIQPFAIPFMALVDRDRLPARSTLSRFLAALTEAPVEALRSLFLADLESRPLSPDKQTGGLVDRAGSTWIVFDIDGTREAARQRALPRTDELPPALRRLDDVCAPGYTGRKRGQVVRTRTVLSQAHSFQWLGSFGNRGNGRYREDLRKALVAITGYLTTVREWSTNSSSRTCRSRGTRPAMSSSCTYTGELSSLSLPMRIKSRTPIAGVLSREFDGSLRLVYAASICHCRPCPLREQCQWNGSATAKPRQVSVLMHPLQVGPTPLLWRDWSRRVHRRACIQLVRHQRLEVSLSPPTVSPGSEEVILSRAQRAHARLSWQERLPRNARVSTAGHVTIKLFGVPEGFAISLGLVTA